MPQLDKDRLVAMLVGPPWPSKNIATVWHQIVDHYCSLKEVKSSFCSTPTCIAKFKCCKTQAVCFLLIGTCTKHIKLHGFNLWRQVVTPGHDYPGLSLIFKVGRDLHKIARIRVAVLRSAGWCYIKVARDVPQNMLENPGSLAVNDSPVYW